MPYLTKKKYGFTVITQPPLTQNLGPWIKQSKAKYSKQLAREKDLMEELILNLPEFDYFSQNWHYSKLNWLSFYWKGFRQTTRYTYVLEDLSDTDKIWNGLQGNIRSDVKKAKNRFGLTVKRDCSIEDYLDLNEKTFKRQNNPVPYSNEFVKNLFNEAKIHNCCENFIAKDSQGKQHAGIILVWDENSAYYLLGGADPELRNSGATSLCIWEAIKFASNITKKFDFEGSMIESVERYFRAFGGTQVPYYNLTKFNSRLFQMLYDVQKWCKC